MKSPVTEIIRRGFENVVANWPLLLIRIAEGVFFLIIVLVSIVAAVIPLVISLGVNQLEPRNPEEVAEMILSIFADHWMVLVYLLLLLSLVVLVYVAIHAFVEGGCARIYVDGERAAAASPRPTRHQMRVFTAERWFTGGKRAWWSVFWIYNIAWGVAGLIVLIPLVIVAALMLVARGNPAAVIGVGCVGLIFSMFFLFAVAVITWIWAEKAIVMSVATGLSASPALSASWKEFRADAGRHIGLTLILFILMIVGASVLSSFSMMVGWGDSPMASITTMPLQMIGSLANTIFSAAMASWMLACFAAITAELRR